MKVKLEFDHHGNPAVGLIPEHSGDDRQLDVLKAECDKAGIKAGGWQNGGNWIWFNVWSVKRS